MGIAGPDDTRGWPAMPGGAADGSDGTADCIAAGAVSPRDDMHLNRDRPSGISHRGQGGWALIYLGIGSNLVNDRFATPRAACEAAMVALADLGIQVLARSRWYESAPVPVSDQPWYVNAVLRVDTAAGPDALMSRLHTVEEAFGRQRRVRNEARILDLDLLDYAGSIRESGPILPHPRLHQRAFVLLPLRDLAPAWRHPVTGVGIDRLIAHLPPGQEIRPLPETATE